MLWKTLEAFLNYYSTFYYIPRMCFWTLGGENLGGLQVNVWALTPKLQLHNFSIQWLSPLICHQIYHFMSLSLYISSGLLSRNKPISAVVISWVFWRQLLCFFISSVNQKKLFIAFPLVHLFFLSFKNSHDDIHGFSSL